jgi:protein required for attachment to host cells
VFLSRQCYYQGWHIIIAAPRTLGELRKSCHKKLSEVLRGEIPKDLTGHAVHDIETTIAAA